MKINRGNNNGSANITIPKKLLEILGWKIGDECIMEIVDNTIIIKKQAGKTFS